MQTLTAPQFTSIPSQLQAMDRLLPLLLSLSLCVAVGADLTPKEYWHSILPHTPIPDAIEQLLQPESYKKETGTSVNVGKGGVNVNTGKGTSVNVGHGDVGVNTGRYGNPGGTTVNVGHGGVGVTTGPTRKSGGTTVNVGHGGVVVNTTPKGKPVNVQASPFNYVYAAADTQWHVDPSAALFFRRKDLRPGKEMTVWLTNTPGRAAALLPRSAADDIPFSSVELPAVLSRFSVAPGSDKAEAMGRTLEECEAPAAKGETKHCVTSVEDMVDYATGSLGTREVMAMATKGSDGVRQRKLTAVKRVAAAGGKGVVSCHAEEYAYAVFFCHGTRTAEVYEVEMATEGGATKVKAVAVCHVDTSGWNPEQLAFKVLGVKPGTVPVCHFLPRDHVVWAPRM